MFLASDGRPFRVRQHFMRRLCEKAKVKVFGFHAIRHLTASILYRKGHSLSHIQAVLRHKNPTTTSRYLRSLGLEQVREALEEGLKGPARVIAFKQKTLGSGSSEGLVLCPLLVSSGSHERELRLTY
jgi:integrase